MWRGHAMKIYNFQATKTCVFEAMKICGFSGLKTEVLRQ
jgi:hypothetical protein